MTKKKNPLVFLDVSIDGDPVERMVFELFSDIAPKTAENFRALCTGEKGIGPKTGKPLHYKGSFFHSVIKGSLAQKWYVAWSVTIVYAVGNRADGHDCFSCDVVFKGGDFVRRDGTSGESIYDGKFPDESPTLKHDGPGLLSMAVADRDTIGSQFVVTFKPNHDLDRKYVVFGQLVQGTEVLKKIENVGDEEGKPTVTVKIINCGEFNEDKRKNKLRMGKDASSGANSYEVRRKWKNKKSRDKRKKRRRHYSSDSESSTDSETESSESDSDSDSYLSSSSDNSSSSDDGHKKRKRYSKREKHRRGKRRDRRRDKKRKRDKRSKHKLRRASDSFTDEDSKSSSERSPDNEFQGKPQKNKEHFLKSVRSQFPSVTEKAIPHRTSEEADLLVKENGEKKSNGIEEGAKSDRSALRQPDVVDDQPSKSRSRSASPRRTMSKNMSISPRRSQRWSPSRSVSRSPVLSRNPTRFSERSLSRTPGRGISRSPLKARKNTSSRSPVRENSQKSISRSPVRSRSRSRSPLRARKNRNSRSPVRENSRKSISRSPVRSRSRSSPSSSPPRSTRKSISRSPVRLSKRSTSRSPVRTFRRSISRSPIRYRRSISRSPIRNRRSISGSPVRSSRRSLSRSSARAPPKRSTSRSPLREPRRNHRRSYSRSPTPVRGVRSPTDRGRSISRSVSPDASPKRIRRGRGFSERYSYARRYRTPSPDRSPVRSHRYSGRMDRERYSSYRRYSPRRYRSPPRVRTPPRYRGRRSRTRSPSVSPSLRYRSRRYGHSRSRTPVGSPRAGRRRSPSQSRSQSESRSSLKSQSPKQVSKAKSRSSSGSLDGRRGLVSYDDGSPSSGR
ncbi:hypothetical protein GQ457_18G004140 [Hibiscus cannabinus]